MNIFIFKKTKRDFKLLQLSRFDSIKRLSQATWCIKTRLSKNFKTQGTNQKRIYSFEKQQIHFLCSKAYFGENMRKTFGKRCA